MVVRDENAPEVGGQRQYVRVFQRFRNDTLRWQEMDAWVPPLKSEDRGRSRTGGPRRPADEPSSGFEIPFRTVSTGLLDKIGWIRLPRTIPAA